MSEALFSQKSDSDFVRTPANLSQFIGPYGYIQCTCEKYPKITHINAQMIEYLGRAEKNSDLEDFLKENIFFTMIPLEERDVFKDYLEQALNSDEPVRVGHHIRCGDDSQKFFGGWLSVIKNENGEKEFAFIYILKNDDKQSTDKENSYFNAFKNTYDLIFEINFDNDTIECIHGKYTSNIGTIYDIVMTIESAQNFWLKNYIVEDDREMMTKYLAHICSPDSDWGDSTSVQCKFRLRWINNIIEEIFGVAIKLDSSTVLFCCRKLSNQGFSVMNSKEIIALRKLDKWMHGLVRNEKESIGMLLFQECDNKYAIIYATQEVRDYFNISMEDYLRFVSQEIPSDQCLKAFKVSCEDFKNLIKNKQMNFKLDDKDEITLTCTAHTYNNETIYEVLIQDENMVSVSDIPSTGIFVRTFGHFDVFVDGQPITFTSEKEKELLALLIDRNGGTLTTNEAISYLWENEEVDERTSARYRKLAMGLKNTLAKHNIEHIMINHHGIRNIDVSAITCDYYELLAGNKYYQKMFHNLYMTNYSWAEETLATLWDYS